MPYWFYEKQALLNTPSIQDGIDHETECQYRKEGTHLIIQITACCCLFLAGKAEETPKKSKDIIKVAKKFLSKDKILSLGEDPREEVMTMEKILLQTMKFDLKVCHPYYYLLRYAKCLKGDRRRKQKMVQMAWTFINDSLCTTLSIQWEPEIIAIAVMYLAAKLVRFRVLGWTHRKPSQTHWWEIFVEDLSVEVVEDICHQVLDLYVPLSRYAQETESSEPIKLETKDNISSHLDSSIDIKVDMKMAIRDPRLENGSFSMKNHLDVSNTPELVSSLNGLAGNIALTPSPATPILPQPMDCESQENPSYSLYPANLSASKESLSMDCSAKAWQPILKKGFSNGDDSQSIDNQASAMRNRRNSDDDDNNNNRFMRRRGFGCGNNDNNDLNENQSMANRGFRNNGRNNRSGYHANRFGRRSFQNNSDDHVENRPLGNRGFGNANNIEQRYNDDRPMGNRGFANANCNKYSDSKPMGNRGFGNAIFNNNRNYNENRSMASRGFGNNNGAFNESKPLGSRGFGSMNNNNNNCNDNDSRPRMRYNRGNRFQRHQVYPRRFNNNHENDRYSNNDANRDDSKGAMSETPGKMLDKQRFYHPSNGNEKNPSENTHVEEESWD